MPQRWHTYVSAERVGMGRWARRGFMVYAVAFA